MIYSLIAIGVVFLGTEGDIAYPLAPLLGPWPTLGAVVGMALFPLFAEPLLQRIDKRRGESNLPRWLRGHPSLQTAILVIFTFLVFFTAWPTLCYGWVAAPYAPYQKIVADWLLLSPFFLGEALAYWKESGHILRHEGAEPPPPGTWVHPERWSFVAFQVRHQILAVAVPLLLLLAMADLTEGYDAAIRAFFWEFPYAHEVLLGAMALGVYFTSPLILKRIWSTEPLPSGPLRTDLEALCRRIGLSYRDILVWKTGRRVINAAVMGLSGRVRYILLSDALIDHMTPAQVRAVFGHEAGHVRHRHIESFLFFALVATLAVSGAIQWATRTFDSLPPNTAEILGGGLTVLVWFVGFGWISRRFERQADLFGCYCVTPGPERCRLPCGVHGEMSIAPSPDSISPDEERKTSPRVALSEDPWPWDSDRGPAVSDVQRGAPAHEPGAVCATAGALFASALHRVALLNGIPIHEPSWRHSSIASRMRFLGSLAGDPPRARRFQRTLFLVQWSLAVGAVLASIGAILYAGMMQ